MAVAGRLRGMEAAQRERRWLVYHQAYLPNMKRPPRLADFVGGKAREKVQQTPDQMKSVAMLWHVAVNARQPQPPN